MTDAEDDSLMGSPTTRIKSRLPGKRSASPPPPTITQKRIMDSSDEGTAETPGPSTDRFETKTTIDYQTKVKTIFIIGGARARRIAAHSRTKLPDPRNTDDWRAFDVAEVGENVSYPTREDARTWVKILEAANIMDGDIVLLDIFTQATWEDIGVPKGTTLPEPHMIAPVIPTLADNKRMQEAVKSARVLVDSLLVNAAIIMLPPHARFVSSPCCMDHMPQWDYRKSPMVLMETLSSIDKELQEAFKYDFTSCYITLREIAKELEPNDDLHRAWSQITSRSSIYLSNRAMRVVVDMAIRKATDVDRNVLAIKEIRKRVENMTEMVRGHNAGGPSKPETPGGIRTDTDKENSNKTKPRKKAVRKQK